MAKDRLLSATGIAKTYGAVVALRDASLEVERGEVHALMGANGAGKSTLVKILTGAIHPTAGRIEIGGTVREIGSPRAAREAGLVSVYQEPSLIPDLDLADNLKLTRTPVEPFRGWMERLGAADTPLSTRARDLPLSIQRIADLSRALAIDPQMLLLDELTAALPVDLVERVMTEIRAVSRSGKAVIYISHRFAEIAALCDRATILRDGGTVGVLPITPGVEERIVELMLGSRVERAAVVASGGAAADTRSPPRLSIRNLAAGRDLRDVSFDLSNGEVLGVVALEGQGQDDLFSALAGAKPISAGSVRVDGKPQSFSHPRDAIACGIAYVPGDRTEALFMHRSVKDNIALPFSAPLRSWGPIPVRRQARKVAAAVDRLQIDMRAQAEVQRLSGGNQQKVTIARWIAADARTLLCYDPTRGIDVRTKQEIYGLIRELRAQGHSILFYSSELDEIPLVCDRTIVIFGGRVVAEIPAAQADEATLTRASYGLLDPSKQGTN